jgi:hypothetical protein
MSEETGVVSAITMMAHHRRYDGAGLAQRDGKEHKKHKMHKEGRPSFVPFVLFVFLPGPG